MGTGNLIRFSVSRVIRDTAIFSLFQTYSSKWLNTTVFFYLCN